MKSLFSRLALTLAVILLAGCAFSAVAAPKEKKTETIVYHLNPGMSCQKCEKKIKSNLRFEKGVKAIATSLPDQTVTVKFDPNKTTSEAIVAALKKLGYGTTPSGAAPAGKQLPSTCGQK